MFGFLAAISALLPWILGATVGVYAAKSRPEISGFTPICAGVGGFFGYLAIAIALWAADQLGASMLDRKLLLTLGTLTVLLIAGLCTHPSLNRLHASISPLGLCFLGLLSVYLASWLYILSNVPALGWDVFNHWGRFAARFIEHSLGDHLEPFRYKHYHPKTLSLVLSWSAWCGTIYGGSKELVWSIPWFGFACSAALLVAGWTYNQTKNVNLSSVAILLLLSIPLFENHALISGYGELPVGVSIIATTVLSAIALHQRDWKLAAFAGLSAASAVFLKNAGVAYAAAPILAGLIVWQASFGIRRLLLAVALVCAGGLYLASHGVLIEVGDFRVGYEAVEKKFLLGEGRFLEIVRPSISDVVGNEFQSRIANSSFSIGLIATLIALAAVYSSRAPLVSLQSSMVALIFALLLLEQFFSQFTGYGFEFATPEKDTGLSRFSLPVFMLTPILWATALKHGQASASNNSGNKWSHI